MGCVLDLGATPCVPGALGARCGCQGGANPVSLHRSRALVGGRAWPGRSASRSDGIGGLQDGEVTSRHALDTLDAVFAADHSVSGLLNACREANGTVWWQATAGGAVAR